MHCAICDADSDAVTERVTDCPACIQAITECLQGYDDPDLVDDPIIEKEDDDYSQIEVGYTERERRDWAYGSGEQSLSGPNGLL